MFRMQRRLVIAVAAAVLALSACTSTGTKSGPASTKNATATSTAPAPSASPGTISKAVLADVTLGTIRVDAKLGTPAADVRIRNHSSKRCNYIVELSITSADGKKVLSSAIVDTPGLAPGHNVDLPAHFRTTQKLPAGAKLIIVNITRIAA